MPEGTVGDRGRVQHLWRSWRVALWRLRGSTDRWVPPTACGLRPGDDLGRTTSRDDEFCLACIKMAGRIPLKGLSDDQISRIVIRRSRT